MSHGEVPFLGTLCCVPNCINSYGNKDCAQFYHFPRNDELCEIWKRRISNPNIMHLATEMLTDLEVCDLHFKRINKTKWGLRKNSLPTLGLPGFLENPSHENCFGVANLQLTVNQLSSVCCICYSKEDLYDIFSSKYHNLTVESIFNSVTNDKYFSKQNYPSNVCLLCIKLLIQSKLLLDQMHNAATLFDLLLTPEQHSVNVATFDCERVADESIKHCQLQRKNAFSRDNGHKTENVGHFASVYIPTPSETTTVNNSINVKRERLSSVNSNPLESTPNDPIDQSDKSDKDDNNDGTANLNNLAGHFNNPIVMSYSTFVRSTRRSSSVGNKSLKYLDTNSGPVIVSYLAEEGNNRLNPSSVQLPSSSSRFSGILNVPSIDIRCNMDVISQEKDQNNVQRNALDSSSNDLSDISQILEVNMDVDKTLVKSRSGKIYRCEECSDEFTDKFDYKCHKKEHNAKKFMCTICQATFNTATECSKHKMSHTKPCEVCGKNIQRKCYMNHLKTHEDGHKEHAKGKGHKPCQKCGRVFKRRWGFHAPCHTTPGPGKFQCDQCPFRAHFHKTLKQHMLVHEPTADQFVCATCGDCFGTEDVLNKHMKNLHVRSAKLLPCKWCPATFETRYDRNKHLTTEHGKKPLKEYRHPQTKFKCSYCSMTFVTADNLRLHLWSHPNATDAELDLNNPSTSKKTPTKKGK